MNKLLIPFFVLFAFRGEAQTNLTLEEAISIAQTKSLASIIAKSNLQLSNYQFELFKINLKPQINLVGSPIGYSQDFLNVIQPDGTTIFRKREQNYSNFGASLIHYFPATNTNFTLGTNLIKFDDFELNRKEYSGIPILLEINQPFFAYNDLKWRKKTEPLKLEQAKRAFEQDKKNIAYETTKLFFHLLLAQEKQVLVNKNKEHQSNLYEIELKKVNIGTTTKSKLLQLELQIVKTDREMLEAQKNIKDATDKLSRYLGFVNTDITPKLPMSLTQIENIDELNLIEKLRNTRPEFFLNKIKLLNAEAQIEEAKRKRFNLYLNGTIGFNSASKNFGTLYNNITQRKNLSIGINMPIVDWGKTKKDVEYARLNKENTELTIQELEKNLIEELMTIISNIKLIKENIGFAFKTDNIASENYNLILQQTQNNTATITDFTIATQQKDEARIAYISSIQSFWETYLLLQTYIHDL